MMPIWDEDNLSAPHTQREFGQICEPGPPKVEWPICADCLHRIKFGTTQGHLPWCPFAGHLEFPRLWP